MKIEVLSQSDFSKCLCDFSTAEPYWRECSEEEAIKDFDIAYRIYSAFNDNVDWLKWENVVEELKEGKIAKRPSIAGGSLYREKNDSPKCICGCSTKEDIFVSGIDKETKLCKKCKQIELKNKNDGVRE